MSSRGRSTSPRPLDKDGDKYVDMDVDNAAKSPDAKVIIVTNLTRNVFESHLQTIFGFYGEIVKLDLPLFSISGQNRGKAALEYADAASAQKAASHMDGGQLDGAALKVELSDLPIKSPHRSGRSPRARGGPTRNGYESRRSFSRSRSRSPPRRRTRRDSYRAPPRSYGRRGDRDTYRPMSRSRSRSPIRRGGRLPPRRRSPSYERGGTGAGYRRRSRSRSRSYSLASSRSRSRSYSPSRSRSGSRSRSYSYSSRSRSRSRAKRSVSRDDIRDSRSRSRSPRDD